MVRIKSIEEIQNFTCFIRSLRKGLITNFYLNVEKHSIWIETGEFFVHETPECIFFLHENGNFYHLFFTATSTDRTGRYINTLNRLAGQFTSDIPSFFLYIYLTIEVSGCRLPVTLFRNAFAEPKFRNKSRRTGRWFKSSVTKKVITSFSFPFLSYSTNEKIRQR